MDERCELPYDHNGDIYECRLELNHDGNCPQANTFRAGLEARTQAAQAYEGPWL